MIRFDSFFQQMQDFFGYYPRFAGTGAGEDELDAAGCYGLLLSGGEGHLFEISGDGG